MPTARKTSKTAARPKSRPGSKKQPHRDAGSHDDADAQNRSNPLGLEVDDEVLDFIAALERFKKEHSRPFPSWSEVLHVLRSLGYRRQG
jgi:hypothetical protein